MVDLGGYIIILTNHNGKIKLYGSPADNADSLEVGDEILEVNGRTLENATHSEVIQHIHQCIKSRTICLRVRRRSGNKMEEFDGPNVGRIRDAWVIAVERGARERLERLTALRKIQPHDIQAILHQQISESAASTSEDRKDVTSKQITVTVADKDDTRSGSAKLSNGTVLKGLIDDSYDVRIGKDAAEKQQSALDEPNLLQPLVSGKPSERRSSSPFQNGRTELLIGDSEGGPRSPRGSTSSAANDVNFLGGDERDFTEPIYRSRRRSSGVTDIHLQQQQSQSTENNNRDGKKPQEVVVGPDEMWAPEALGHHRELPVDVPDALLQKAYPNNKVTNRSRTESIVGGEQKTRNSDKCRNKATEKDSPKATEDRSNVIADFGKVDESRCERARTPNGCLERSDETDGEVVDVEAQRLDNLKRILASADHIEDVRNGRETSVFLGTFKGPVKPEEKSRLADEPVDTERTRRQPSFDVEDDYPFANENYPTMLKTCSDDSTSPRSSSGRSDSTAPLDNTLLLRTTNGRKDSSPAYDARRIDLGSPCRSIVSEIKIPIFGRGRDATFFDNPAYGLNDIQDLQGLLLRPSENSDLTKLIDEQCQPARIGREDSAKRRDKSNRNSKTRRDNEVARLKAKSKSLDAEELIAIASMDDISEKSERQRAKKKNRQSNSHHQQQQYSSGYSTLRSEASGEPGRSYLAVGGDTTPSTTTATTTTSGTGNKSFRELPVDCPEDFVPVTKCHPVYPPPSKSPGVAAASLRSRTLPARNKSEDAATTNDKRRGTTGVDSDNHALKREPSDPSHERRKVGLNGVKPAIPPRDQKRAPARPPKDTLRLSTQNNNVVEQRSDDGTTVEPTQQQLHSIRKYQEQLRKRKDEEERLQSINRSLRGSKKLQALESHATSLSGQENLAYAQDEVTTAVTTGVVLPTVNHAVKDTEEPPKSLTYGEVVATLERLQLQLRSISGALGISGPSVEAELEAVRTLLVQSRFATALATHHALKNRLRSCKTLKHHTEDSSGLARDCVEILEKWQSSAPAACAGTAETIADVEELTGILTNYDMEALLMAHDSIVSLVDGVQRKPSTASSSSPSGSPSPSSSWKGSRGVDNIKIIRIEKTNEPLGATVRNEGDAVTIGRVVRGGAADKSGLLHEGDEVLEVNGVEMRGKSVNEVCDILAGMQGSLTFLVLPAPTNQRNNLLKREETMQIQHIRAHFDYDPEEDPYIPCRELGVSFQKGDVLHVVSQEDANWWQAYREGEEDQTLAGLIPSRAFQHQRESMKQTIAGDKSTMRGSKKSSTLLCAKKNPKKKKRNKFGANYNDDGYPLYATPSVDDYDSEEVLTYEEVALYYPRANHKRPIVLIGPPNIGRHELRQRLMQDSERFAAAIPHTSRPRKDSEVDGQDYHFISRSQFESDILCRKFVEHGEYEKAYYGTSVEAIRSVVNSGKICVLNLHPQSLKILRNSDLKPYVVFVAPPSLEKLKQKRIKNNESFKEEELKDIIEKAREMEDKYGHLFDMIIINNDTDRAYSQLLTEINSLEREPQWVPASWVQ